MLTRADLLQLLQTLAAEVGPDLTVREFQAATGISPKTVSRLWENWGRLRRAAGLPVRGAVPKVYSDDDLFIALSRAGSECGRFPTVNAFQRVSGRSWQTLERRFGNRIAVWQAYREWLRGQPAENSPEYVRDLPESVAPEKVPGLLAQGAWRQKSAGNAGEDWDWGTDFEFPEANPAEILADWLETHRRLREMGSGRSGAEVRDPRPIEDSECAAR